MRLTEIKNLDRKIRQLKRFAQWAMTELDIETPPKIEYGHDIERVHRDRTYGSTKGGGHIWVHVGNRTPADAMRTLCHELVHHRQFELGIAHDSMTDEEELAVEDQANALAGRMMRQWGKRHGDIYESRTGSLTHEVADSLPQAFVIPALDSGNPYMQYKFGVAIAGARGAPGRALDNIPPFKQSDLPEVFSDKEVVISFDPHIDQIIDAAMKELGIPGGKRRIGVKGSRESTDVYNVSPVRGFKGFDQ